MSKIMKGGVEYAFGSSSIESGSSLEVITREEYDALVANGTVKTGVYYFISEDNGTPEWVYDESTGKITGYKTKIGGADTVFPFSSVQEKTGSFNVSTHKGSTYNLTISEFSKIYGVLFESKDNGSQYVAAGIAKCVISGNTITFTVSSTSSGTDSTLTVSYTVFGV